MGQPPLVPAVVPTQAALDSLPAALKPLVEVILLTGHATVETAIQGMKLGAFDYLIKPAETEDLVDKIQKAHVRKAEQEERIRKAEINGIVKRRGW